MKLLVLFLFLFSIPGWCQTAKPAKAATASVSKNGTDAELERAIRARFAKSKAASMFTVRVQGGIATIEGSTNVIQHKGVATRLAKNCGARTVVNNVKISEGARQKAGQTLARSRKAAVKRQE